MAVTRTRKRRASAATAPDGDANASGNDSNAPTAPALCADSMGAMPVQEVVDQPENTQEGDGSVGAAIANGFSFQANDAVGIVSGGAHHEDMDAVANGVGTAVLKDTIREKEEKNGNADEDEDDEEDEEEELLVVLELADFLNHPILDDYRSITIEGIDTATPKLHIGEYSLHGQLEETVGTHYFYDTKNLTQHDEYRFVGQTTKKIKFTIAPPDKY